MPLIPENLVLKGSKVILRPSEEKDYPALQKILSDLKTMEFLQYMSFKDQGGWPMDEIIKRCEKRRAAQKEQTLIDFIIHGRKTDEVMGNCGFTAINLTHKNAEFGIILHHPFWQIGINTECRLLCFEYAFETLGLHRIEGATFTRNHRVHRFYERIGIRPEGVKKEVFLENGQFLDDTVYAIFEKDWPRVKQKLMDWNVSSSRQ